MAFPDDYRRVQIAGGVAADVNLHIGLPRQLLVDTTNWNLRVLDGVTEGGKPVAMIHDLPNQLQSVLPAGEVSYVENPAVNDPDQKKLLWRSGVMRSLFAKIADMTDAVNWLIKDSALRSTIRQDANLVSDLNAAIVSGWYRFNPSITSNIPAEISPGATDQYMLLVIRQSSSDLSQMIIDRSAAGRIWVRSRVGGIYQAWSLATGVTSGDLATKVSKAGDTMTGKLIARIGAVEGAQLNLRTGVAPTVKEDGDIWRDDSTGGIMFQKGGNTVRIVDTLSGDASLLYDHTFESTDVLVKDPNWPANARVIADIWAGGGGGYGNSGGGGGFWRHEVKVSDLAGSESVIVGTGGAVGAAGGSSSFAGLTVYGGGPSLTNASGYGGGGSVMGVGGTGNTSAGNPVNGAAGGNDTGITGGGGSASSGNGRNSIYGGGAGNGGTSIYGGKGGSANGVVGSPRGGGGARNAAGGRGEIRIRVYK